MIDGNDMIVADGGGGPGLAQEPVAGLAVRGHLRQHDLQRGRPAKLGILGEVDCAHSAVAERLDEAIRPELVGHGRRDRLSGG